MKYLKISNDGVLDIRLVALMGGTTKANDQFKIGQFGTGLKYTLAYLFRNNLDFKLYCGEEPVNITIETEIINNQNFDIICINNHRTSITTQMGADWSAWMIIRELWCNALDEGGADKEVTSIIEGVADKTTFYIQIDSQFEDVLRNWGDYFLLDQKPLSQTESYSIYPGGNKLRLYKNGILIFQSKTEVPAIFSYDIHAASINELREYKGTAAWDVTGALKTMNADCVTNFIESVTEDHYEGKVDWSWYSSFAKTWSDAIGNAKIIHQKAIDDIEARGVEIDLTGTVKVPKNLYMELTKQFKGIGALRTADKVNEFYEIHSEALSARLNEALVILEVCNYPIHPELKFVFGTFGDKVINAQVNLDTKEVLISDRCLEQSLFNFIAILIEENEHFNTGFADCSRNFQQHFINLYTKKMLDLNQVKL